jgi:hypothetical protein
LLCLVGVLAYQVALLPLGVAYSLPAPAVLLLLALSFPLVLATLPLKPANPSGAALLICPQCSYKIGPFAA